jgi:hypothetical protein
VFIFKLKNLPVILDIRICGALVVFQWELPSAGAVTWCPPLLVRLYLYRFAEVVSSWCLWQPWCRHGVCVTTVVSWLCLCDNRGVVVVSVWQLWCRGGVCVTTVVSWWYLCDNRSVVMVSVTTVVSWWCLWQPWSRGGVCVTTAGVGIFIFLSMTRAIIHIPSGRLLWSEVTPYNLVPLYQTRSHKIQEEDNLQVRRRQKLKSSVL